MSSTDYQICWRNFQPWTSESVRNLFKDEEFADVTLVTNDLEEVKAHKVILSASSPFFNTILKKTCNANNPLIFLRGIGYDVLCLILKFIYEGEVNVPQEQVNYFMSISQDLRVRGLNVDAFENNSSQQTLVEKRSTQVESRRAPQTEIPKQVEEIDFEDQQEDVVRGNNDVCEESLRRTVSENEQVKEKKIKFKTDVFERKRKLLLERTCIDCEQYYISKLEEDIEFEIDSILCSSKHKQLRPKKTPEKFWDPDIIDLEDDDPRGKVYDSEPFSTYARRKAARKLLKNK